MLQLLKSPPREDRDLRDELRSSTHVDDAQSKTQYKESEKAIVCAVCSHQLAYAEDRCDIDGLFEHIKMNPSGVCFRIWSLADAVGCAVIGPATSQYSWFTNYAWQFAHCSACSEHLGWFFSGMGDGIASFYGLIADKLLLVQPPSLAQ